MTPDTFLGESIRHKGGLMSNQRRMFSPEFKDNAALPCS